MTTSPTPPPRRSEAEVVADVCATMDEILADEEATRPLAAAEIRLVRAANEAFRRGKRVTQFLTLLQGCSQGRPEKAEPPEAYNVALQKLLRRVNSEAYQFDFDTLMEAVEAGKAEGRSSGEVIDLLLGPSLGEAPEHYFWTVQLVARFQLLCNFDCEPEMLDTISQILEDALEAGSDADPHEMVRASLDRAAAALRDRRLTRPLEPYELDFAQSLVTALQAGVSPTDLITLLGEVELEGWPEKPKGEDPEELTKEIRMPRGGLFALGDAEDAHFCGAALAVLMRLMLTLRLRIPRELLEDQTRKLEAVIEESAKSVN